MAHHRVLLVGWDGADWNVVSGLIERDRLPHLRRIVDRGTQAALSPLVPATESIAWTSLATGVRPSRHGVLAEMELEPGSAMRPISASSRRVPAMWDLLAQAGRRTAVVGWPASHPATSSDVRCLSELSFSPASVDALAGDQAEDPGGAERLDVRMRLLTSALAAWESVHAAARRVLAGERPDLLAVRFGGLATILASFLRFHGMGGRRGHRDDTPYADVVVSAFSRLDTMLGELVDLAGARTTVAVVSPYGFPRESRPGFFCANGTGVRGGQRMHGMSPLDVAPTLLALFGVTVPHAEGRVRTEVAGACVAGLTSRMAVVEPAAVPALELPPVDSGVARLIRRERRYNFAVSEMEAGRHEQAAVVLEALLLDEPADRAALLLLARCELALGRLASCRGHKERILSGNPEDSQGWALAGSLALADGRAEEAAFCFGLVDLAQSLEAGTLREIGIGCTRVGQFGRAEQIFRRLIERDPDDAAARDGLALVLLKTGRAAEAARAALSAVVLDRSLARAHFHLGVSLARCGRPERAADAFQTCLALRPDATAAHEWLAHLYATALADPSRAAYHRARTWAGAAPDGLSASPEYAYDVAAGAAGGLRESL